MSQPPTSLAIQAAATLNARATFALGSSNGNTSVTWSVSCGMSSGCGTFSGSADADAVTYTAPSSIPTGAKVTVTATSVADATKSASATIQITAPIPISVSFYAPPPASLIVGSSFGFSAAISNDVSANPQMKWTLACGAADCGSLSLTTTAHEQVTTYTAPAAIPAGGSVTITVTSVTDATKSASTRVAIAAPAPTLANGTYVFQMRPLTGTLASFMTGVLVANNGAITGGEQDSASFVGDTNGNYAYATFQQILGGSYATTQDGNVQISLQVNGGGTETLIGTLGAGQHGFVGALNGAPVSGTLELQTSTASPAGGYAISLGGNDQYGDAMLVGGVLNVDGPGTVSGQGSVLDVVGGAVANTGPQMLTASTVSAPDAHGRVVMQLNPGVSSLHPLALAGYVVDATHVRLMEILASNGNNAAEGVLGGVALGQGADTGRFSMASVAGSSYVIGMQGSDTHGSLQVAGVVRLQAGGAVSGTLNWNDLTGSGVQSPIPFSGSYTVDATGRVSLNRLSDGSTFQYSLQLYLTGDGSGLALSNDTGDVLAGQAFEQQTGAFTAVSLSGGYGLQANFGAQSGSPPFQASSAMGSVTATPGSGTVDLAGIADNGVGTADFAVSGSFTPSANGVFQGTLAGLKGATRDTASGFTLYMVDGTQGVLIETDAAQLTLGRLVTLQ